MSIVPKRPPAHAQDQSTLLMVGSGDPMDVALEKALDRHGLFVESVTLDRLRDSVLLTAPDVVLLIGDAAAHGGEAALRALAADQATGAVPVVLLAPDSRLESKMHAFRHGAMAVVARSASPDAVARKVAELSKELSTHFEEKTGEIGEATFDELVDLVKKELRSGILSVHAPGHRGGPMRVVLGAGRPVAEAVQEFVARLKPHVAAADPMYYQFHMSAGGAVGLLQLDGASDTKKEAVLGRLRVLLVDNDPARADALAQELRSSGALVFVTDETGRGLERAVGLDPQVAIVDQDGLEGRGFEVVRRIRKDLRLRWASILVAPWSEIWPAGTPTPDMEALAARIEPLLAPERDLKARGAAGEAFDVRLESTGPSRLLRLLVDSGSTLHVTVRNPKVTVEIDLAEGLVVGATAALRPTGTAEGARALAALLALGSGRVHIEPRANPSVANVMSPVDEALSAASEEPSPVKPSLPPSSGHVLLEDDEEPPEASSTQIKDLSGLASAAEVFLDESTQPAVHEQVTVRPASAFGVPKPRRKRRQQTLVMGAPVVADAPRPTDSGVRPSGTDAPADLPPDIPDAPPIQLSDIAEHAATVPPGATPVSLATDPPASGSFEPMASIPAAPPFATVEPTAEPTPPDATPPFEPRSPPETEPEAAPPPEPYASPPAPPEPAGVDPFPPTAPLPQPSPTPAAHDPFAVPAASEPPRPRRSPARTAAFVFAALLAVAVLILFGLIAYRASGLRQPQLDGLLALIGAPPPDGAETPDPEMPDPETPDPETPDPETPDPETPDPETPDPETPDPETPDPETPDPETPDPETPDPETPDPEGGGDDRPLGASMDPEELVSQARRAGDSDLAVNLYRRALALDSRNHHAMVGLGRILTGRNQPAEAVELLRAAVQRRPRRASYRVYLGDALAARGDGAGAQREYREALRLDPDDRRARQRLGQ